MPESRSFQKITSLLGCLIFGGANALPAAGVEPVPFEGRVDVGFRNQYNFRGFESGDWAPSIAADFILPARTDSELALNLGGWYIDPLEDSYDEFGVYAYLVAPVADFEFKVGGIFFAFPGDYPVTGEFGAAAFYSVADWVVLELAWWSDVKGDGFASDELRFGHYTEFSASTSSELKDWLSVELRAGISYAIEYYGSNGLNHAFGTVGFPIGISETIALRPHVGGTLALEGLEAAGESDQFLTGISLVVEF